MLDELLDHAVPLSLLVLRAVFVIGHQPDLVGEAQDAGQLLQQVDAKPFKAVVADKRLVRLLKHDVWLLLCTKHQKDQIRCKWWGQRLPRLSAFASNWSKVIQTDESLLHLSGIDSEGATSAKSGYRETEGKKKWKYQPLPEDQCCCDGKCLKPWVKCFHTITQFWL